MMMQIFLGVNIISGCTVQPKPVWIWKYFRDPNRKIIIRTDQFFQISVRIFPDPEPRPSSNEFRVSDLIVIYQ